MLTTILDEPWETLLFGARQHAMLAAQMSNAINHCFDRDDWTCHVCGIRLPDYMEVDHLRGHHVCPVDDIQTICQFCHNLRHLAWATNRGRLRMIWAPKSSQIPLNILAWQVLLASPNREGEVIDEELAAAATGVSDIVKRRERILADIIGATPGKALFQVLLSLDHKLGKQAALKVARRLDGYLRFWPIAADRMLETSLTPAADFSHWRDGDFYRVSTDFITDYWQSTSSLEGLHTLIDNHQLLDI